jgi:hypothetical protein
VLFDDEYTLHSIAKAYDLPEARAGLEHFNRNRAAEKPKRHSQKASIALRPNNQSRLELSHSKDSLKELLVEEDSAKDLSESTSKSKTQEKKKIKKSLGENLISSKAPAMPVPPRKKKP